MTIKKFEVLVTAAKTYSDKKLCSTVDRHWPFGETCCLHIEDRQIWRQQSFKTICLPKYTASQEKAPQY